MHPHVYFFIGMFPNPPAIRDTALPVENPSLAALHATSSQLSAPRCYRTRRGDKQCSSSQI